MRKAAAKKNLIRPRLVMAAGWKTATDFRHIGAMADIQQHCLILSGIFELYFPFIFKMEKIKQHHLRI